MDDLVARGRPSGYVTAPSRASSSSPTGTAGGRVAPVRSSAPEYTTTRCCWALVTASRNSWRSSWRASRSPTSGSRARMSSPSRPDPRGNAPSSIPSSATTRCGTARIGASEHTVSAPVRKFARVGRPARCGSSSATTSGEAQRRARRRPHARRWPGRPPPAASGRPGATSVSRWTARSSASNHSAGRAARRRARASVAGEPVDELREPPDQVHVARADVVDRQDGADEALVLLGHRHPEQEPVQRGRPRALRERARAGSARAATTSSPHRTPDSSAHARTRSSSSSSNPNRRRTGAWPARSTTADAPTRESASSSRVATTASTGFALAGARSAIRTRSVRPGCSGASVVDARRRAERRLDQRRERLDVRAHDDDVARFEGGVVGEQADDHLAQHLDLAGAAVAGVDLDRAVARRGVVRRAVGAVVGDPVLERAERRCPGAAATGGPRRRGRAARTRLASSVASPAIEASSGCVAGVGASDRRGGSARGQPAPERERRLRQPQVDLAVLGERVEHPQVAVGERRGTEDRQPRRQVDGRRVVAQPLHRLVEPLRRRRHVDGVADRAPQAAAASARSSGSGRAEAVLVAPVRPGAQHRRALHVVRAEQAGHPLRQPEPAAAAHLVVRRRRGSGSPCASQSAP